jgi:hypothetical protein
MKTNESPRSRPPLRCRRRYDWPPEAERLARQKPRIHPSHLVQQLHNITGHPVEACWRFVQKFGIQRPTRYRSWSGRDQGKVLEMSELRPVPEIAKHFGVSAKAIYHVVAKNHRRVARRSEWFGLNALAKYLTVKPEKVRGWIASEMLRCVVEEHGKLRYTLIAGAELVRFCKTYKEELLRQRIPEKRILFLVDYVIAADVADDYTARSSKLEREAFERKEYLKPKPGSRRSGDEEDDDEEDSEDHASDA